MKLSKIKVLKAIPNSQGIISTIAKRCGVTWNSIQKFLVKEGNEDVLEAYNNELNSVLDMVESNMFKTIKSRSFGSEGLTKFYLAKKGKDRGYGEDKKLLDITTNGENINVIKLVEVIKENGVNS